VVSLLIGLFIATIGIDITAGYPRFNFGNVELMGGVSFIPAMIGMFAIGEILRYVTAIKRPVEGPPGDRARLPGPRPGALALSGRT
jgi:TctA family transporter